jgi:hypothetical protein
LHIDLGDRRDKSGIGRPGEEYNEEYNLEDNPDGKNNETVAGEGVGGLKEGKEQTHRRQHLQQSTNIIECILVRTDGRSTIQIEYIRGNIHERQALLATQCRFRQCAGDLHLV